MSIALTAWLLTETLGGIEPQTSTNGGDIWVFSSKPNAVSGVHAIVFPDTTCTSGVALSVTLRIAPGITDLQYALLARGTAEVGGSDIGFGPPRYAPKPLRTFSPRVDISSAIGTTSADTSMEAQLFSGDAVADPTALLGCARSQIVYRNREVILVVPPSLGPLPPTEPETARVDPIITSAQAQLDLPGSWYLADSPKEFEVDPQLVGGRYKIEQATPPITDPQLLLWSASPNVSIHPRLLVTDVIKAENDQEASYVGTLALGLLLAVLAGLSLSPATRALHAALGAAQVKLKGRQAVLALGVSILLELHLIAVAFALYPFTYSTTPSPLPPTAAATDWVFLADSALAVLAIVMTFILIARTTGGSRVAHFFVLTSLLVTDLLLSVDLSTKTIVSAFVLAQYAVTWITRPRAGQVTTISDSGKVLH